MYLSEIRQKALDKAKMYFKEASNHLSTQEFRLNTIENQGFYDGTGQWHSDDLVKLIERKQRPMTINVCKGFIDNLSGVEVQSRYRVATRSGSLNVNDDKLASVLTTCLYQIQESEEIPYKDSLKFMDALVTGIGWSSVGERYGKIFYDYVNPLNMIPDPEDLSPQYDNMRYVCRKIWMSPDIIKNTWPKSSKYIDFDKDCDYYESVFSAEIMDRNSGVSIDNSYNGRGKGKALVVEVQYKIPHKYYVGIDKNGRPFETFSMETAEKISESKSDIELKNGERIMRTIFYDDILLEHAPLNNSLPNQKDFSFIPIVYKRTFSSGVPYGLMDPLKDLQRDFNVRVTKALYAYNSKMIVMESMPMEGRDKETIVKDLKSSDSVVILPLDSKFQVVNNSSLGKDQMDMANWCITSMQKVTGIYDEMLGQQTNATSALAQNVRQVNSVRNNVFAFDSFSQMKKRTAKFITDIIQTSGIENLAVEVLSEDQKETVILNLTREVDGELVVFNDIRTIPLTFYVEEVPDYQNSFEENKAALIALANNPNASMFMSNPEYLRAIGVRDPEKMVKFFNVQQDRMSQMPSPTSPIPQMTMH